MRGAAAYAYGLLGTKEGLKAARALLYADPDPAVRTRAIEGLVEGARPGAARLLVGVFASEVDVRVRAAAARGVVGLETPELVEELMARLEHTLASSPERVALVNVLARFDSDKPTNLLRAVLQGDDIVSADAAALGLAKRWDDSSISQLVRMLESGRSARAAIRHLQILTSRAFEAESFRRQAENYKGWFQTNSTGSPLLWFRDALEERGYETAVLGIDDSGEGVYVPPEAAVPTLLRILRDEDWYVRRNASYLLRRRIGRGAPEVITHLSTPAEEEAIIRALHDWWNAERKKKISDERG